MIAFIVWIRMQMIFWVFIPVALGTMFHADDLLGPIWIGVAVVGFVFGLPGIVGNYLYLNFLKRVNIPRQQVWAYLLIGLPFIMLCCVANLFWWMATSTQGIWDLFGSFSGLAIAVVIATVLSTFSCHRSLFNYIYPVQHDEAL